VPRASTPPAGADRSPAAQELGAPGQMAAPELARSSGASGGEYFRTTSGSFLSKIKRHLPGTTVRAPPRRRLIRTNMQLLLWCRARDMQLLLCCRARADVCKHAHRAAHAAPVCCCGLFPAALSGLRMPRRMVALGSVVRGVCAVASTAWQGRTSTRRWSLPPRRACQCPTRLTTSLHVPCQPGHGWHDCVSGCKGVCALAGRMPVRPPQALPGAAAGSRVLRAV